MSLHEEIDFLLSKLTDKQRCLFASNIEMWKKTTNLNGRSQSTDSFEVDSHMLMREWKDFIDSVYEMKFD